MGGEKEYMVDTEASSYRIKQTNNRQKTWNSHAEKNMDVQAGCESAWNTEGESLKWITTDKNWKRAEQLHLQTKGTNTFVHMEMEEDD